MNRAIVEAQDLAIYNAPGRVCVLYTGGTIGMRSIQPSLHAAQEPMLSVSEVNAELRKRSDIQVDFDVLPLLCEPGDGFVPIVSSQIKPSDWKRIAATIEHHYDDYDGFVVLHGTDTMAWTASALSFMFVNLSKPVVLTGSQRPIAAAPSDAVPNFVNSVMLAARADEAIPLIAEVVICFGDLVLRGNRATKISAASLQGFDTPNTPHLGRVGRRFDIQTKQLREAPEAGVGCFARLALEERVTDVMMYPGMGAEHLERALQCSAGAVLRSFGAGNAPGGSAVQRVLRAATDGGRVIVNVTQANEGTVEDAMLTGSRALTDCGVLSGLDLTAEAALTKLMLLLGSEPGEVVREQMQLDQRGEQSLDLIELRSQWRASSDDLVARMQLARSLHARVHPELLRSATLRLQFDAGVEVGPSSVSIFLNHWGAARSTRHDLRSLGEHRLEPPSSRGQELLIDLTDTARQVLQPGAPVSLTVVPGDPENKLNCNATLTLFMDRVVKDPS